MNVPIGHEEHREQSHEQPQEREMHRILHGRIETGLLKGV